MTRAQGKNKDRANIVVSMDPELLAQARRLASDDERTVSSLVRILLRRAVEQAKADA